MKLSLFEKIKIFFIANKVPLIVFLIIGMIFALPYTIILITILLLSFALYLCYLQMMENYKEELEKRKNHK